MNDKIEYIPERFKVVKDEKKDFFVIKSDCKDSIDKVVA